MTKTFKVHAFSLPSIIDDFFNKNFNSFFDLLDQPSDLAYDFFDYPPYPVSNIGIEENGDLFMEIGVPGFNENELDIEFIKNELHIKGEKKSEESKKRAYIARKLAQRNFKDLKFTLSKRFDFAKTQCKLNNGILYIDIPLKEEIKKEEEPRKITIQKAKEIS